MEVDFQVQSIVLEVDRHPTVDTLMLIKVRKLVQIGFNSLLFIQTHQECFLLKVMNTLPGIDF